MHVSPEPLENVSLLPQLFEEGVISRRAGAQALKGPARGHITSPQTQNSPAAAASPSRDLGSLVFLLKLMCPSRIIGTSQTGHANLRKTPASSLYFCGCHSLRKLRDGGCYIVTSVPLPHRASAHVASQGCPVETFDRATGSPGVAFTEPSGSSWGCERQQEGARGEQALSGLALPL